MDKNELKMQALLERISSLTTQYENQVADLRVELTVTDSELQSVIHDRDQLSSELEALKSDYVEKVPQPED